MGKSTLMVDLVKYIVMRVAYLGNFLSCYSGGNGIERHRNMKYSLTLTVMILVYNFKSYVSASKMHFLLSLMLESIAPM